MLVLCLFPALSGQNGQASPRAIDASSLKNKPAGPGKSAGSGWHLRQNSQLLGDCDVLIAKNAVRIIKLKDKVTTVSAAPDWTTYVYSDSSKKIFSRDLEHFGFLYKYILNFKDVKLSEVPGKSNSFQGFRTVAYRSKPVRWGVGSDRRGAQKEEPVEAALNAVTSLKAPKEISKLLFKFYGLPVVEGVVPITFSRARPGGKPTFELTTSKIEEVKIPANAFIVPHSYTKVDDARSVLIDGEQSQFINEFVKGLGHGK